MRCDYFNEMSFHRPDGWIRIVGSHTDSLHEMHVLCASFIFIKTFLKQNILFKKGSEKKYVEFLVFFVTLIFRVHPRNTRILQTLLTVHA